MKQIFIVDYLGIHCGMHYYNDAFKKVLSNPLPNEKINILSNYPEDKATSFFLNFYSVNKLIGIIFLVYNYIKLYIKVLSNKKACFIYLTYGNSIDIPFLWIISKAPKHIIDIHEAIGQNVDANLRLKKWFKNIYSSKIKSVITHSQRTNNFLNEYDFQGLRLSVPHFKYCFKKTCNENQVEKEIQHSIAKDKINILFFGNINYNKGIDILIQTINALPQEQAEKLNIIIAGKDFDGTIHKIPLMHPQSFQVFLKHINDDELVFLYKNTDYVVLPYRKTSQSGILEMAFYFKKPIIASNIPYFNMMLSKFKSFGMLTDLDIPSFTNTFSKIIQRHTKYTDYYIDTEYSTYTNRQEITSFSNEFSKWIKK
ncbi:MULTISPECIES: glycosyltransferase [Bacteroides]|uniref:glycosyltransferase n=1 Tax=Bacteroides TaxID=816 RepID=UPI0018995A61|nr:glycosyltransferase [Bacteroides nordii]MCG4771431.1 glycosyltransferase [Bacteroides nordii]MCQ4916358.1 glycosyltransferase [Bacteroides nordii]